MPRAPYGRYPAFCAARRHARKHPEPRLEQAQPVTPSRASTAPKSAAQREVQIRPSISVVPLLHGEATDPTSLELVHVQAQVLARGQEQAERLRAGEYSPLGAVKSDNSLAAAFPPLLCYLAPGPTSAPAALKIWRGRARSADLTWTWTCTLGSWGRARVCGLVLLEAGRTLVPGLPISHQPDDVAGHSKLPL